MPFGSPATQSKAASAAAASASRLVPVLDDSGVWGFTDLGDLPDGAFIVDPIGSGVTGIDPTITMGLKSTLFPSGVVGLY